MITCPWCGMNYTSFQSSCESCGGSLPLPVEKPPEKAIEEISVPPPAPRNVPRNYAWRVLSTDGWAISGGVFFLIGAVFGVVGMVLTVNIITAFIGLPFLGIGVLFFTGGAAALIWRYQEAHKTADVLRDGEAVLGEIETVHQNLYVRVNGRHPWTITYWFDVHGREYLGKVTTLSQPDLGQRPGKGVYVLYQPENPDHNTIYPHPYGYYSI